MWLGLCLFSNSSGGSSPLSSFCSWDTWCLLPINFSYLCRSSRSTWNAFVNTFHVSVVSTQATSSEKPSMARASQGTEDHVSCFVRSPANIHGCSCICFCKLQSSSLVTTFMRGSHTYPKWQRIHLMCETEPACPFQLQMHSLSYAHPNNCAEWDEWMLKAFWCYLLTLFH